MRKVLFLGGLLSLTVMVATAWAQTGDVKVVLAPFKVYSQESLPKIQETVRNTLAQQLKEEGVVLTDAEETRKAIASLGVATVESETQARSLGQRLRAAAVIYGVFSKVGNHISIDAKLVDVQGVKKTEVLMADDEGIENLTVPLTKIRQQAAVHLLSKAVIAEVNVRGTERIEAAAVKAAAKSAKGEVLRPAQLRDDIKSIYALGYFEEVQAEQSDGPGGKILTFVVKEKSSVSEVRVKGNKAIKEKDIMAAIQTKPYTVLQMNVVNDDVQRINKLYSEKAFHNVVVSYEVQYPKDPRQALVTFNVQENKKMYINKIKFTGNKSYTGFRLRNEVMQTKEKMFLLSTFTDRGVLQEDKLNTDVDRLTAFYHDNGFMDAKVDTPKVIKEKDGFTIEIPIEEGSRYKVSTMEITGDSLDDPKANLMKVVENKPKSYFSREKLRKDVERVQKQFMNEGYAYVDVKPQVQRDPATHTTSINLQVHKGQKITVERVLISGNTKTRDQIIRRQIKLSEGELFSGKKLERSNTALKKLDYFETYDIVPTEGSKPDAMNLNVKVKEKNTGAISIGGGFSSDDGLFAGGEIYQRNLFGRGQSLSLKAQIAEESTRYSLSFIDPFFRDTDFAFGFDLYNWERDYTDFTKDARGAVVKVGHPFGEWSRFLVSYNYERAQVTDVAEGSSVYITSQEGWQDKSSVTFLFERDTTDHPYLATRGSLNTFTVELSSTAIGSDSDFASFQAVSAWYFPLFGKFVGYVRGKIGYIDEWDKNNPVPVYDRFYLGGINSHRAFDWGELGPHDPTTITPDNPQGDEIGGLAYGLLTAELLFPLIEKLNMRGVVFFDYGNAFMTWDEFDLSEFRPGAGVGIVWGSPFGPLRVYWAYNLDQQPGDDAYKFQFSMGYYF
jgi:outer membrane protein insertion porin family